MQKFHELTNIKNPTPRKIKKFFREKENFNLFLKIFFPKHFPLDFAKIHLDLMDDLLGKNQNLAVAYPRGFAKSTIITFGYTIWRLLNFEKNILIFSATNNQTKSHLENIASELENNKFLKSVYRYKIKKTQTKIILTMAQEEKSLQGYSTLQSVRGINFKSIRPELIILDDIESEKTINTKDTRTRLEKFLTKTIIPLGTPDTRHILIGTTLAHNSLLNKIITKKIMPNFWQTKKISALEKNNSVWEERWSTKKLLELKETLGTHAFNTEYMNIPSSEEDQIIKNNWIKKCNVSNEKIQIGEEIYKRDQVQIICTLDPAISKSKQADYTAYCILAILPDENYAVLDCIKGKFTMRETIEKLKNLHTKWHFHLIGVETVAYQLALYDEIKLANLPIKPLRPDTNKIRRLLRHQPLFEFGKIYFSESCQDLIEQLLEFPNGNHDDCVDALTYAISMGKDFHMPYIFGL